MLNLHHSRFAGRFICKGWGRTMIFKQGVSKGEWFKLILGHICVLVPYTILVVACMMRAESIQTIGLFLLVCFAPLYLILCVISLRYLEWYHIYDTKIEARGIFGIKNTVYFDQVTSVEEVEICLTTRGMKRIFYIFRDGRQDYGSAVIARNSCYNKKRFTFRVHKTRTLEAFLKEKGLLL